MLPESRMPELSDPSQTSCPQALHRLLVSPQLWILREPATPDHTQKYLCEVSIHVLPSLPLPCPPSIPPHLHSPVQQERGTLPSSLSTWGSPCFHPLLPTRLLETGLSHGMIHPHWPMLRAAQQCFPIASPVATPSNNESTRIGLLFAGGTVGYILGAACNGDSHEAPALAVLHCPSPGNAAPPPSGEHLGDQEPGTLGKRVDEQDQGRGKSRLFTLPSVTLFPHIPAHRALCP